MAARRLTLVRATGLGLGQALTAVLVALVLWVPLGASARTLQACGAITDDAQRLACYDRLAGRGASQGALQGQRQGQPAAEAAPGAELASGPRSGAVAKPQPISSQSPQAAPVALASGSQAPCRDLQHGSWSRFWELTPQTDCGTFHLRGYRPLSVSLVHADRVNRAPSSPAPGRSATAASDYRATEMRVQLSVRTKIATGLLTHDDPQRKDSLWFAYTQQSYWQLFSGQLSRPFRATDHEPEFIYVYPLDLSLPAGWRLRYAGLGVVHQSNGQSLPLSRSWNRTYLTAGADLNERWLINARLWHRVSERSPDDDNPGMADGMGRAELRLGWQAHRDHTLSLTLRHALHDSGRGSARLEWFKALVPASGQSDLRLHTQLFSGYGDSLTDYNFRRTVFSVGLSLLDF
jgi:phospholipase A1